MFGTLIALLLAGAGAIGTWAALRVGKNAQVLKNYRDVAASWKEKAEAQEDQIKDLITDLATAHAETNRLSDRVTFLQDAVTGKSAIDALAAQTTERYDSLSKQIDTCTELVRRMAPA